MMIKRRRKNPFNSLILKFEFAWLWIVDDDEIEHKMSPLCNATENILPLKPPSLFASPLSLRKTSRLHFLPHSFFSTRPRIPLIVKPSSPNLNLLRWGIRASAAEIDMVRNKEGVFAPAQKKVVILWDLDNKPPRGPPYHAAMALKHFSQRFGDVVDMSAYANRHAFVHLPTWVVEERRERRRLDLLERKGVVKPSETYVCGVCGRKCRTHVDLKKHFKQLHERERQKKLNRMRSLKGKKRQRYKERFISGNHKYEEAARVLVKPKVGYGLASELRRAGVFVKTVEDKPQAADWALKKQMQHSMSRGVDWLFLVSDDSDFSEMLRRAREANLGTVVVGDRGKALGQHAEFWVPWIGVENGEITDEDLMPGTSRRSQFFDSDEGLFSTSHFDGDVGREGNLDDVVDELAATRPEINGLRISAFSEGEEEEFDCDLVTSPFELDSEDEETWEEDVNF